jgi:hypothetical protein
MMDKFRVGQKVRIIDSKSFPEKVGEVYTIASHKKPHLASGLCLYDLEGGLPAHEDCLEPVYDGESKSSWSSCAWKPSWIKSHG